MKTLSTLVNLSREETLENNKKTFRNAVQQDSEKLEPYDNTALLDLIDYMNEMSKPRI